MMNFFITINDFLQIHFLNHNIHSYLLCLNFLHLSIKLSLLKKVNKIIFLLKLKYLIDCLKK